MLITASAVSSPIDPVPSWESTANGLITDDLSSLNNKNNLLAVIKLFESIDLSPGPSYESSLDSIYKAFCFNHFLYGSFSLSSLSIEF